MALFRWNRAYVLLLFLCLAVHHVKILDMVRLRPKNFLPSHASGGMSEDCAASHPKIAQSKSLHIKKVAKHSFYWLNLACVYLFSNLSTVLIMRDGEENILTAGNMFYNTLSARQALRRHRR